MGEDHCNEMREKLDEIDEEIGVAIFDDKEDAMFSMALTNLAMSTQEELLELLDKAYDIPDGFW